MFRYGLVGNTLTYGGIMGLFAYVGFELNNIINLSPAIDEDLAKQIFDPRIAPKISLDQKEDMRKASAKQFMQDYKRRQHEPKEAFEQIQQRGVIDRGEQRDM